MEKCNDSAILNKGVFPIRAMSRLERLLGVPRHALRDVAFRINSHYHSFSQSHEKPDGTVKIRNIDEPRPRLKEIQRRIAHRLLKTVVLPPSVVGGVKKRSYKSNARYHLRQPEVVTFDLKNCFPNTKHAQVYRIFTDTLGCSPRVANLLTKLTTYNGYLPQGTPTSTAISNLCLSHAHQEILSMAQKEGLRFSQYVDDFALSGPGARRILPAALRCLTVHGYKINRKKTVVMTRAGRQFVTGITVNRNLSVRKNRYQRLRHQIQNFNPVSEHAEKEKRTILGGIVGVRYLNRKQSQSLSRLWQKMDSTRANADSNAISSKTKPASIQSDALTNQR